MSLNSGISTHIVIGIVILLLLTGSFAAYRYFDTNNIISLPGLGTIGLNSSCKHNDANLCKYINRSLKADFFQGSYVGTTITTDSMGKTLKSVWETDGKTKSRMANYIDSTENFHMITIGKVIYVKDFNDGKWWRQQEEVSIETETKLPDAFHFDDYKKKAIEEMRAAEKTTSYAFVNQDICGDRTCFQYQVFHEDPEKIETKEFIYFDDKDYILYKSKAESADGTITQQAFSYGSVTILEPSPLKQAQPGQNIFMTADQGGSYTNDSLQYLNDFEQQMKKTQQVDEKVDDHPTQIQELPMVDLKEQ